MNPIVYLRRNISKWGQQLVWLSFSRLYLRPKAKPVLSEAPVQPSAMVQDNREQIAQELTGRAGNLSVITRAEAGNVLAAYSFRFVALPWTYFYDSMKSLVSQPDKQFAEKLTSDVEYRNKVITDFFTEAAQGVGSEGFEYLREELFHHEHLRHTSMWVFSQGFAMLLRFAAIYLAFKRMDTQHWKQLPNNQDYLTVNRFLFNISFTAAYLKSLSFPVIEGYAHYPELKNDSKQWQQIRDTYGAKAADAAQIFHQFEEKISSAYGKADVKPLVAQIAEAVVDIPITQSVLSDRLSYNEVRRHKQDYKTTLQLDPYIRLKHLQRALLDDKLPDNRDDFAEQINILIETSDFEKNFSPGLLWYFTRPYVPDQLVWFIMTRLLFSKYGFSTLFKIIWDMLTRGGKQLEHHAYSISFPAIRIYAPDGKTIIYDPALELFAPPKTTPNEQAKTEPGVTAVEFGFRGYQPQILDLILLQTVIIHLIVANYFNYPEEDSRAYRTFMLHWILPAGNYPENLNTWLDSLNVQCEELVRPLQLAFDDGQDPLAGTTFQGFTKAYEELFWECWQALSKDETQSLREAVLLLGDGLYMHGLA